MRAIWQVRWQDIAVRIRFWTAIVGYDPRDRTLRNYIYLLYVVVFFSIWGFAVLSLLADAGSAVLSLVTGFSPPVTAVMLLAGILLLVTVIEGYRAAVRSPFLFSDTDAELICQTPVNRSQVAIAWFIGDWISGGLLYSAFSVILRFASMQMVIPGGFTWSLFLNFLLAGLLTTSIVLPLHMAFSALDYSLGALRLQRGLENHWIRWIPIGVGLILAMIVFKGPPLVQAVFRPVLFPLYAAFDLIRWLPGFAVALLFACLGLSALYASGRGLNLSRAAQESRSRFSSRQAAMLGNSRLGQRANANQKLGLGHTQSKVPAGEGFLSIVWKSVLRYTRQVRVGDIIGWLVIFGVSLALLLATDLGTRLWAFVFWGLQAAQRGTAGLKEDIRVWSITRQLPFSARELLMAESIAPATTILLLSWIAFIVGNLLTNSIPLFYIFLFPTATFSIVFSAAFDLLRHCRTSELLAGQVAELGAGGLLIGLILAGLPILFVSILMNLYPAFSGILILLGSILGIGFSYSGWSVAALAYSRMR